MSRMHPSYLTFWILAYASSLASRFSNRNFQAIVYPVNDIGCVPFSVPLFHWICQAATYLSIKEQIQLMVLSSLGNFAGWSSTYTCILTHKVSKSPPGFPSNSVLQEFSSPMIITTLICLSTAAYLRNSFVARLILRLNLLTFFKSSSSCLDPTPYGRFKSEDWTSPGYNHSSENSSWDNNPVDAYRCTGWPITIEMTKSQTTRDMWVNYCSSSWTMRSTKCLTFFWCAYWADVNLGPGIWS